MKTLIQVLSKDERAQVHERSLRVLARTGVRVDTAQGRQIRVAPDKLLFQHEGESLEGGGGRDDEVEIVLYEPERVVVEAHLAEEGYLVLTDAYYPGWRALVDGREVPIHRADVLFRAVRLPAGRHRVEFIYDPLSFKIGAVISLAALLGVVAALARPAAAALKAR